VTTALADLWERLPELMLRDEARLRRRLDAAARLSDRQAREAGLAKVAGAVDAAWRRVQRRRAAVPALRYPQELPVSERKDDILAAIRDNQVVIVAGETGSGKTTQLPKICLELGRGVRGAIGHTQPRRIAARTVAERIADELGSPLRGTGGGGRAAGGAGGGGSGRVGAAGGRGSGESGGEAAPAEGRAQVSPEGELAPPAEHAAVQPVGYKVRFTDAGGRDALVKLMTDGILLAELAHDRMLLAYDTIILDEAHERSLNIDFLLGYLKQLLPRRPDLKVVVTSATIDPDRFSRHFDGAPVVEVSGRTYPVEVRYRPLVDPDGASADPDRDAVAAICDAVGELSAEPPGDILVFLSGEREIRDAADALARLELRHTEVLPLYARLSAADQHRVFQPHVGRRIVLATNVAETSLTVPGIRYVVDPGTARISRFSRRTKMQRLPVEPISQASANQRKGRCGRTADGVCIRLYAEDDFLGRPEFTDPEILRTNLASVILRMALLGLGDVADFPFVEPPDRRAVADGVALLHELGAIETGSASGPASVPGSTRGDGPAPAPVRTVQPVQPVRLTQLGRRLAQLPLDPRIGRMVLEAERNGCLDEVMVIAAGLSVQDPRERPADAEQAAAAKHARFAGTGSDFLAHLELWKYLRDRQGELSSGQFRRMCKAEYVSHRRVREWQDVHGQLRQAVRDLGLAAGPAGGGADAGAKAGSTGGGADPQRIHTSLLAGLLSHIGLFDPERRDYAGARGARFSLWPGSELFKKPPRWAMAAELVETSRAWGRIVARIEPEWVEPLAGHLVVRSYSEPHWSRKQGAVLAYEKVTLYGVPLVVARTVNYSRVDPASCRELFIRHALVEGDWQTRHAFFHANRRLLADVEELEHRLRRRGIGADDEAVYDFYDRRLPAEVVSARHFDSWWKKARRAQPSLLDFTRAMLLGAAADGAHGAHEADFPDAWHAGGLTLPLTYQFEPGSAADGVTAHVPLAALGQLRPDGFDWGVPGMREELVTELIRCLPKALRRSFVPAPNYAGAVLDEVGPDDGPLLAVLEGELHRMGGTAISRSDWQLDRLPPHLRMTFRVLDDAGAVLGEGKDLEALKRTLAPAARAALAGAVDRVERRGLRSFDIDELPRTVKREHAGHTLVAHPALVDEGGSVAVRLFGSEAEQREAMAAGTRRLVLLGVPSPAKWIVGRLGTRAKLALNHHPHASVADLLDDCIACAADALIDDAGGPAWDAAGFAALRNAVRAGLNEAALDVVTTVEQVLSAAWEVEQRVEAMGASVVAGAVADVRGQLGRLVYPGFVAEVGRAHLADLPRYLTAVQRRLDKLPREAPRDAERMRTVAYVWEEYQRLLASLPPEDAGRADVRRIRWMIEELRVSLFAQALRTPYPISPERILRAVDAAAAGTAAMV
jgi:ATP-dependent helicase HrpA